MMIYFLIVCDKYYISIIIDISIRRIICIRKCTGMKIHSTQQVDGFYQHPECINHEESLHLVFNFQKIKLR